MHRDSMKRLRAGLPQPQPGDTITYDGWGKGTPLKMTGVPLEVTRVGQTRVTVISAEETTYHVPLGMIRSVNGRQYDTEGERARQQGARP